MKKVARFLLLIFLFSLNFVYGQGTLTFQFANPRTIRIAGFDNFEFDIQVKASVPGTYLWSGQAILLFDNTTFTQNAAQWSMVRGPLLTGTNTVDNNKYTIYKTITGITPGKVLNIGWTGDVNVSANSPNPNDFNEVPTTYTTLVTLRGRILSTIGVAGIDFIESSMNGQQFYCTATSPYYATYGIPNLYDPHNFLTTYVGRVYSGAWGWSQVNNAVNTQWVDWGTSVNTSVWDTATTAATIATLDAKAAGLRIHSKGRLKILSSGQLTCSGPTDINESKGLWIVSNATGTGSFIDNGTITYALGGSVLTERYITPSNWHGYCIPVNSTTTAPYTGVDMKYWTEANQSYHFIIDPPPPDSILNGLLYRGYMTRASISSGINRLSTVGSINTGPLNSIPVTRTNPTATALYNGYNCLGNPYPSTLDLGSNSISWINIDQKAWFLNPGTGGNYEVYLVAGGGTHSQYAPSQQAFFVHHTEVNATTTQLLVNNSGRTHNTQTGYINGSLTDLLYMKAQTVTGEFSDLASVYFRPEATLGYDEVYDADKLWGDPTAPQLYSIILGRNLSVNAIPWSGPYQVVPLGFNCANSGSYKIVATNLTSFNPNIEIYLEDVKLNITQSLRANSEYQFVYTAGEAPNRFVLHFTNPAFPTIQASNIIFSGIQTNQFSINWTDGNGGKRVVFIKQDSVGAASPAVNASYTPNTIFGTGTQIGSTGWYCVFNGTTHGSGVTITNLNASTKYRVMVCEYNESPGSKLYNPEIASNNPKNQRTCNNTAPSIAGNSLVCLGTTNVPYSTAVNMTSYTWSVPGGQITGGAGTNAITVTWTTPGNKTVNVSYRTADGCDTPSGTKNVTVQPAPGPAGTISGLSSVCVGTTGGTYCVPQISDATSYNWLLPPGLLVTAGSGTNCITVNFPNTPSTLNLSVFGVNQCFNGSPSSLPISVNAQLTDQLNLTNMTVINGLDLCFSVQSLTTAGGGTSFVVQNGGAVTFIASQNIKLLYGTSAHLGGYLHAYITTQCIPCTTLKTTTTSITLPDGSLDGDNAPADPVNSFFKIYPNPTTGEFTLEIINGENMPAEAVVRIHSMLGEEVVRQEFNGKLTGKMSLLGKPGGIYLISVLCGEKMGTVKIIKR